MLYPSFRGETDLLRKRVAFRRGKACGPRLARLRSRYGQCSGHVADQNVLIAHTIPIGFEKEARRLVAHCFPIILAIQRQKRGHGIVQKKFVIRNRPREIHGLSGVRLDPGGLANGLCAHRAASVLSGSMSSHLKHFKPVRPEGVRMAIIR